jgi:hypothetical protein
VYVVRCGVVWCGVVGWGVVWCGVVWLGVVWGVGKWWDRRVLANMHNQYAFRSYVGLYATHFMWHRQQVTF